MQPCAKRPGCCGNSPVNCHRLTLILGALGRKSVARASGGDPRLITTQRLLVDLLVALSPPLDGQLVKVASRLTRPLLLTPSRCKNSSTCKWNPFA